MPRHVALMTPAKIIHSAGNAAAGFSSDSRPTPVSSWWHCLQIVPDKSLGNRARDATSFCCCYEVADWIALYAKNDAQLDYSARSDRRA